MTGSLSILTSQKILPPYDNTFRDHSLSIDVWYISHTTSSATGWFTSNVHYLKATTNRKVQTLMNFIRMTCTKIHFPFLHLTLYCLLELWFLSTSEGHTFIDTSLSSRKVNTQQELHLTDHKTPYNQLPVFRPWYCKHCQPRLQNDVIGIISYDFIFTFFMKLIWGDYNTFIFW